MQYHILKTREYQNIIAKRQYIIMFSEKRNI